MYATNVEIYGIKCDGGERVVWYALCNGTSPCAPRLCRGSARAGVVRPPRNTAYDVARGTNSIHRLHVIPSKPHRPAGGEEVNHLSSGKHVAFNRNTLAQSEVQGIVGGTSPGATDKVSFDRQSKCAYPQPEQSASGRHIPEPVAVDDNAVDVRRAICRHVKRAGCARHQRLKGIPGKVYRIARACRIDRHRCDAKKYTVPDVKDVAITPRRICQANTVSRQRKLATIYVYDYCLLEREQTVRVVRSALAGKPDIFKCDNGWVSRRP